MTDVPGFAATECANGHLSLPGHQACQACGAEPADTVDLAGETGEVVTWTTSYATPPGVREPNTIAIVEFDVDGETVRVLGGTTDDVSIGDPVEPVYVAELRDPEAGIREPASQDWDGFRFEPRT
jgi:uncharacterized OB-fold protein